MRAFAVLLLASALLTSCQDPVEPALGDSFTLAPGQSARFGEGALLLRFSDVQADSRCPRDVQCVWAGDAVVRLEVAADSQPGRLELHVNPAAGASRAGAGAYTVELLALAPERVSTQATPRDAYRATLRVSAR